MSLRPQPVDFPLLQLTVTCLRVKLRNTNANPITVPAASMTASNTAVI
jgi:hypothetical protein